MSVMAEPERFLAMANFIEIWCWILGFRKNPPKLIFCAHCEKASKTKVVQREKSVRQHTEKTLSYVFEHLQFFILHFMFFDFIFSLNSHVFQKMHYILPSTHHWRNIKLCFSEHLHLSKSRLHYPVVIFTFLVKHILTFPLLGKHHINVFGKMYYIRTLYFSFTEFFRAENQKNILWGMKYTFKSRQTAV